MTENSMTATVSIGVMTYNHRHFIRECLDSIRLQDYPLAQVIVSDDLSTDGTVDVIRAYQADYPDFPITLFAQATNLGVTANCNFMLKQLNGKYIACFAGDDVMLPGKIRKQVAALEKNPQAPFCYSNCEWFDSATGKKIINHFGLLQQPPKNLSDVVSDFTIPTPTLMMRATAIPPHGYDTRLPYLTDFFICVELMRQGDPVYIPEVLVRYRKHADSLMAKNFFIGDREKLIVMLDELFANDPAMASALKGYKAIYAYAFICEHLNKGDFKAAFRKIPQLFPYCLSSVKWLVRDAWMALAFLKALKRKTFKPS